MLLEPKGKARFVVRSEAGEQEGRVILGGTYGSRTLLSTHSGKLETLR